MTISDALIIYFALAAPFAVYRYLQSRKTNSPKIWFDLIINFIFWLPLATSIGVANIFKVYSRTKSDLTSVNYFDAVKEEKVHQIETLMKKEFRSSLPSGSINDFREVFERYVGLTSAADANVHRKHGLFSISEHPNQELAETCLNRRNRNRLDIHQTKARVDFLNLVRECEISGSGSLDMTMHAVELAEILGDRKTSNELISGIKPQFGKEQNFINAASDIWIPAEQKRSNVEHSHTS